MLGLDGILALALALALPGLTLEGEDLNTDDVGSLLSFLALDMVPKMEVAGLAPSVVLVDSLVVLMLLLPKMLVVGLAVVVELAMNENEGLTAGLVVAVAVPVGAGRFARKEKGDFAPLIAFGVPKPKKTNNW